MRKDLIKPSIKSSFLSCEKDTETILRKLFIESKPYSDILKKLLVINTKDCLTATGEKAAAIQEIIDSKSLKNLMEEQYISIEPKIIFREFEDTKSYILITFDDFVPNASNPEYRDCTVIFDVLCHTDDWALDNFQLRPLKIVGYIDGILNETKLSGIGKFHFIGCSEFLFTEDLSGYTLMYRAVHDVDGDDKIPPLES